METNPFSQASLLAFLACKRRFQLRYLDKLSWPDLPFTPQQQSAVEQGQKFHQLVERHILGLGVKAIDLADSQLQLWWRRFEENVLPLPRGRALPELRLTVPIGSYFLAGRFDLVIIGDESAQPSVTLYDWKTSRARTAAELEDDWQSRIYLAMLAESRTALVGKGVELHPDQITLSYWYVTEPQTLRTLNYSQQQHEENWTEILAVVDEIDSCMKQNDWPLTANWSHCRSCAYWSYCGRFEAGMPEKMIAEDLIEYELDEMLLLEPESP